jgi:hypothetical protein
MGGYSSYLSGRREFGGDRMERVHLIELARPDPSEFAAWFRERVKETSGIELDPAQLLQGAPGPHARLESLSTVNTDGNRSPGHQKCTDRYVHAHDRGGRP